MDMILCDSELMVSVTVGSVSVGRRPLPWSDQLIISAEQSEAWLLE